eukprot:1157965-Pelagomonas_calceolata.AAC.6
MLTMAMMMIAATRRRRRRRMRGLAGHNVFLRGLSFDVTAEEVAAWFNDLAGLSTPVTPDRPVRTPPEHLSPVVEHTHAFPLHVGAHHSHEQMGQDRPPKYVACISRARIQRLVFCPSVHCIIKRQLPACVCGH